MRKRIFTSFVFVFLAAGLAFSQTTPKAGIKIVGMTPYTLVQQYGSKGSSMYPSTGLNTVGEKTIVYLQAIDSTGGTIQSVKWSVIDPPGGTAQVDSQMAFTTITLDTTGEYTVSATITESGGATSTTSTVLTSANYVGVGSMGIATNDSATAATPQCGTCHQGALTGLGLDPTADYSHWMNTWHASFFKENINGVGPAGSGYSAHCIQCHTTGYNPTAANGNFAAVANKVGWTFPSTLADTNFAHLYHTSAQLAQLGTIGCESCHGPGSEHWGDASKISVSLSASDCMQCHDAPPHHAIGREWTSSPHDSGMAAIQEESSHVLSAPCAQCHTAGGFFDYSTNGKLEKSSYSAMPLTCSGCHNPHDATNPYQLRDYSAPALANGFQISEGGAGQLCMNCHRSRSNVATAVNTGWTPYFGPHEGPQTDVFFGQDGYTFGDSSITGLATHTQLTDACVTCHMASDTVDPNAAMTLGGHTWKMSGPDALGDTTDNTTACQSCHGPITDFNQIPAPYDYAGIANGGPIPGVQTEVKALLAKLASLIPDSVLANPGSATVGKNLTKEQLGAVWDYLLISKDGSYGVHNAKYTFALLTRAIGTFTGVKVVNNEIPQSFTLKQNYPNPFNPTTTIDFSVPKTGVVNVSVYNSIGQLIKTLTDQNYVPGTYQITWNGMNNAGVGVASGVYFYKLTSPSYVRTMKMMLLK